MRGLPNSTYKVFATKDNDANYQYSDRSEGLAFSRESFQTTLRDSMRTDTIRIDSIVRRDTLHRDSLVTYPFTYYFPSRHRPTLFGSEGATVRPRALQPSR